MSATDELRRMLDERGVPYETNDDMGASETRWNGFTAYQLTPNAKLVMHPTPEQAIAATLGNELNPDGLPVIVRCRDCVWFTNSSHYGAYCTNFGSPLGDDYDGFCAWGERK